MNSGRKRDRHLFSNHRPVSLLPQFSNILEQLFVQTLDNFIDKHNLSSDHQFRFWAKRSTLIISAVEVVENISTALDNKEYIVGLFIDLIKAFDTVDQGLFVNMVLEG